MTKLVIFSRLKKIDGKWQIKIIGQPGITEAEIPFRDVIYRHVDPRWHCLGAEAAQVDNIEEEPVVYLLRSNPPTTDYDVLLPLKEYRVHILKDKIVKIVDVSTDDEIEELDLEFGHPFPHHLMVFQPFNHRIVGKPDDVRVSTT